jgi:integrase
MLTVPAQFAGATRSRLGGRRKAGRGASWLACLSDCRSSGFRKIHLQGKVVAELMGHAKVDTTLNVYTQVIDGAKLAAAQAVGNGLIEIERNPEGATALIH